MSTSKSKPAIDFRRVKILSDKPVRPGPVLYWMGRDQRVRDNWALLYAQRLALEAGQPLAVVFNLVPEFLGATERQYRFMTAGLRQVARDLERYNIPFFLTEGKPEQNLPALVERSGAGVVVADFSPLRIYRGWKAKVAGRIETALHDVDAHNIVPCRVASDKLEYAAYTLRPKIHRLLSGFLTPFPRLRKHPVPWTVKVAEPNWSAAGRTLGIGRTTGKAADQEAGESAAFKRLKLFIKDKLPLYAEYRNDPNRDVQSGLSGYLHFGQISAQRVALEIQKHDRDIKSQEAFLEELIVRRELSDNFCLYNPDYDTFEGFPAWALRTLREHAGDPRPHLYDTGALEAGETHDPLWNAAQMEMVVTGRMHGYLRMYWAKKLLQWSPSAQAAMETAVYLNDRYQLDGRDPNGYAGIAWSIGGVHDRPWFERDIFGKVRYMSYDGCRRKFDVDGYVRKIADEVRSTG